MTLPSKMSPDAVAPKPFLSADDLRARTFVRHVEFHETLDSTNNRALELARNPDIELPALVVAHHQTAGRGRGTNKWWSADGALTFSLLIDPSAHGIAVANWPQLSLTAAVAVCDAIDAQCKATIPTPGSPLRTPCSIKWPNDVFINDRKVAGILLESPGGAAPAKDRVIIGIGVNVNNSWRDAPPDVAKNGIALCDATDRRLESQELLTAAICATSIRIENLRTDDISLAHSCQRLNWLAGQYVVVQHGNHATAGRCMDLARDGALVLETSQGLRRFFSGSVVLAP